MLASWSYKDLVKSDLKDCRMGHVQNSTGKIKGHYLMINDKLLVALSDALFD